MYDLICHWDNLQLAYTRAAQGKRGQQAVAAFEYRLADHLLQLQHDLVTHTYQPGPYHSFYIHDPKRRLISAAPFRDRVVHHALCNVIEPLFERSFVFDSYANRVGKGTHAAIDRAQHFARRYRYVLQCDMEQFFPSIDHQILRDTLARQIDAADVLRLIDRILHSGAGVLADEYEMKYFPGDDLFALNRPRGLPIGNLTSQFWANCFLNPFDHFIKRELRCPGYVRYVDDVLLFSDDRAQLQRGLEQVVARLARLRLTLHAGAHVRPVTEGFPFLGFVVYPDHRRLKPRKVVAFHRKLNQLIALGDPRQVDVSLQGWINHVRYGNTWGLRRSVAGRIPIIRGGQFVT